MDNIHFKPNVPQFLSLSSPDGELDDYNQVHYFTSCGRRLTVSHDTAVRLNLMELAAGETFGICKDVGSERGAPAKWRVWLTPETEQSRAAAEPPSDLEQTLSASLALVRGEGPRVVERKPPQTQGNLEFDRRGTGTHGPAPLPAVAKAPARPKREAPIPYNVAFREVTQFVTRELGAIGEQWNDQAKQDMISTVLIAAAKQGILSVWERGEK